MASELRRRVAKSKGKINGSGNDDEDDIPSVSSEDVIPVGDQGTVKPGDEVKIVQNHHRRKRKLGAIFLLGSLFGIIAAGFFAKTNDLIDFPEIGELSVDNILDILPAGLVKDVRDLVVCSKASFVDIAVRMRILIAVFPNRKESEST